MKFQLTGKFGELAEVRGNQPHTGIDFAMPQGTSLRSLFSGTVEKVYDGKGPTASLGNGVKIDDGHGHHIIYGHMSKVNVHKGEQIDKGEFIGLSGSTGNSTGPHLHFGMKDDSGHFVDPTNYAEQVANLSGDNPIFPSPLDAIRGIFKVTTPLGDHIKESVKSHVREKAGDMTREIALGIWDGLSDIILETIGAVSLVGCTILIIMKIAGYDKGYKQAGMLFVFNVLAKLIFGGNK